MDGHGEKYLLTSKKSDIYFSGIRGWNSSGVYWQGPGHNTDGKSNLITKAPEPLLHVEYIQAVLEGKVVQQRGDIGVFFDLPHDDPMSAIAQIAVSPTAEFRIKPDVLVRWIPVVRMTGGTPVIPGARVDKAAASFRGNYNATATRGTEWQSHDTLVKVIRLEINPDTLEVINHRTEAPE